MHYTLTLGNSAYSSWSLRGWLLFKAFAIPCEHRVLPLYTDEFEAFKKTHFPARRVPTLEVKRDDDRLVIWDSLSIAEFLNEQHPGAGIWPADTAARAAARSLCAEMHAGFHALRDKMPMNLRRRYTSFRPDAKTQADIERVVALWHWARSVTDHTGPFMFGEQFCAADVFFTPVGARFHTYAIPLDATDGDYKDALLAHPATAAFYRMAEQEDWVLEHVELNIE